MAVRKKFLLSFNRLLPDSKLCFRTRLDSTLYVNKREAKKLYNSTQNPTFYYSLLCFSVRYEMYGLCFKPYTNYTQNYTLRRSKPYTNTIHESPSSSMQSAPSARR